MTSRLGPRKLFEAFIGIARRQFPDQNRGYQATKQWLSDLESYTHPQIDINEKESFSPPNQSSLGLHIIPSELVSVDLPSNGFPYRLDPPLLSIPPQAVFPQASVTAQLLAPASATPSSTPTGLSSPTTRITTNRKRELQNMSLYTSLLKAYGTRNGIVVDYEEERELQVYPARFYCRATVGAFTAEGRGSSKKEAQHRASKALQDTFPEPFESL